MADMPFRVTRPLKRVLLVLLTGSANLTVPRIADAAMVSLWRAERVMKELERSGWADSEWWNAAVTGYPRFRAYHLTSKGYAGADGLFVLDRPAAQRGYGTLEAPSGTVIVPPGHTEALGGPHDDPEVRPA